MRGSWCGFPTCFAGWSTIDPKTFNESPATYSWYDSQANPMTTIAATSNGHVWVGSYNLNAQTFGGWSDLGSATGTAADSAPAIALYNKTTAQPNPQTADQSEAIVVVHANNGKYEYRDIKSGNSWVFLPTGP